MIKKIFLSLFVSIFALASFAINPGTASADGTSKKWAYTHYSGWEVMRFIKESGIMDKWNQKYGTNIEIVLADDYVKSIEDYMAGKFLACTMTNIDALTMPAAGGIDSTVLIAGSTSNGNDGIVLIRGRNVQDIAGRNVRIVKNSVSHYFIYRVLTMNGMTENDVNLIDTTDANGKILAGFQEDATKDPKTAAICTWNPHLMNARYVKRSKLVIDSSSLPSEIIDCTVANTNASENEKMAMTGAWYEAMQIMSEKSKRGLDALQIMVDGLKDTTINEFKSQLKTTAMLYKPADAVSLVDDAKLKETMKHVCDFGSAQGIYKNTGIEFTDGSTMGDANNITLRFTSKYMKMAADGTL